MLFKCLSVNYGLEMNPWKLHSSSRQPQKNLGVFRLTRRKIHSKVEERGAKSTQQACQTSPVSGLAESSGVGSLSSARLCDSLSA